jgi:hypothetical protein
MKGNHLVYWLALVKQYGPLLTWGTAALCYRPSVCR